MAKGIVEAVEKLIIEVDKNRAVINDLVDNLNKTYPIIKQKEEEIEELKKRVDKLEGKLKWKRTDLN